MSDIIIIREQWSEYLIEYDTLKSADEEDWFLHFNDLANTNTTFVVYEFWKRKDTNEEDEETEEKDTATCCTSDGWTLWEIQLTLLNDTNYTIYIP